VNPAAEPEAVVATEAAGPAVIRGGALRTAGYLAGLLLGLVAVPVLTRHLGVEDFGRYVLVMSLVALVAGATEGGLTAVGTREWVVLGPHHRREVMRHMLGLRLLLTTLGVAGAVAFAVAVGYDRTLVIGILLASAAVVFQTVQNLLTAPLSAELRFGWITAAELLRQFVTVVLIVALVLAGATLLPFFAAAIPAAIASSALVAGLVRKSVPLRPALAVRESWRLLRETLPVAIALAVNVTYFRIALIVMSLEATELETGYFATSFRIMEILLGVPTVLVTAIFPVLAHAAEQDRARLGYTFGRALEVSLILGVWMLVCLEVGADTIISIVAGDQAAPAAEVLRIQAPAILATFVAYTCSYVLLSLRRHGELLVANLAGLVLAAGLSFALITPYASHGAAVAAVVAEYAVAIAMLVAPLRAGAIPRMTGRFFVAVALAAALAGAIALLPVPEIPAVVLASAVYFGVIAALGAIPHEVRTTVRHVLRRPA
jgi:O-antigen/teichoic acid export membrane protein